MRKPAPWYNYRWVYSKNNLWKRLVISLVRSLLYFYIIEILFDAVEKLFGKNTVGHSISFFVGIRGFLAGKINTGIHWARVHDHA